MLPNFFVLGAQKAGTTSLHNYLCAHPQIFLPARKETLFFADDDRYAKGISFYEKEYYSGWSGQKSVGEVDPDYMYIESVPERMAEHIDLSVTKLVFLLRNPVDRAYSHYLMTLRRGIETMSFEEALVHEEDRIARDFFSRLHFSYVARGFYLPQIERFVNYTDMKNMMFILSDDLKNNTLDVLNSCYRFLGVRENIVPPDMGVRHRTAAVPKSTRFLHLVTRESIAKKAFRVLLPHKNLRLAIRKTMMTLNETTDHGMKMADQTRTMLSERYRQHNIRLGNFIGCDLSGWNCRPTE